MPECCYGVAEYENLDPKYNFPFLLDSILTHTVLYQTLKSGGIRSAMT